MFYRIYENIGLCIIELNKQEYVFQIIFSEFLNLFTFTFINQ